MLFSYFFLYIYFFFIYFFFYFFNNFTIGGNSDLFFIRNAFRGDICILLRSIRWRFPAYTFFKEENRGNGRFLDGSYPLLFIYIYLFIYLFIFVLIFVLIFCFFFVCNNFSSLPTVFWLKSSSILFHLP